MSLVGHGSFPCSAGSSISNPLFAVDNTLMFFADGKPAFLDMITAIKEEPGNDLQGVRASFRRMTIPEDHGILSIPNPLQGE